MKHSLPINSFIKLAIFFNVIYIGLMFTIARGSQCGLLSDQLAIVSGIAISMIFNGFLTIVNFFPDVLFSGNRVKRVKDKKADVKSEVKKVEQVEEIKNINDKDTLNLVGVQNNPYINPNAERRTLKLTSETDNYDLYNIKDFRFRLEYATSALVYGQVGAGKSSLTFALLDMLNRSEYNTKFIIADYGALDWPNSEFKTTDQIFQLFEWLMVVNRGRQLEGIKDNDIRIVVLLEEAQAFLSTLQIEDKKNKTKRFDEFILITSQIALTSRKTKAMSLIAVMQNPKVSVIDSNLRENLGMVFGLKSSKNLAGKIMQAPTEIARGMPQLQPGIAYSHLTDCFFSVPKMTKPDLPMITRNEIYRLKESYLKRFGDEIATIGEEQ